MKHLLRSIVLGLLLLPCLPSARAHASDTTYTSRASFEAALSSFQIDSLDGITSDPHVLDVRADFSISTPSVMYGCINQAGCGDNSGIGFDSAYEWTYNTSPVTFTFNAPASAIGFDYANPTCCGDGSVLTLDGNSSGASSGFFGIISDTPVTSFVMSGSGSYMLIDNITYGQADVPEPASMALFGLGVGGLAMLRRRRKAA